MNCMVINCLMEVQRLNDRGRFCEYKMSLLSCAKKRCKSLCQCQGGSLNYGRLLKQPGLSVFKIFTELKVTQSWKENVIAGLKLYRIHTKHLVESSMWRQWLATLNRLQRECLFFSLLHVHLSPTINIMFKSYHYFQVRGVKAHCAQYVKNSSAHTLEMFLMQTIFPSHRGLLWVSENR